MENNEKGIVDKNGNLKYILGDKLGEGNFGVCYICKAKEDNKEYAIKIIPKEKIKDKNIYVNLTKNEIEILQTLDSPKIVKIKEYLEDKENIYIIQELCKNNTLSKLLFKRKYLTEIEVQNYIFQLIEGLHYLHSKKIVHRDIKPNNILLDSNLELKIGDFGLSTMIIPEGRRLTQPLGTRLFMAPEILNITEEGYSFEIDIWSLGIVMYNLLTASFPFKIGDEIGFPETPLISKEAKNLIKQILVNEPKKRPKLNQIVYHDFFHKNTFPKFMDISTLNSAPNQDDIIINIKDNNKIIYEKLYDLVVEFEEIKYENIEKYVINDINLNDYFNYWIIDWNESKNEHIFYYILNNELKGVFLESTNNKFILDENLDKIYEIKDEGKKEEIIEHSLSDYPENLKQNIEKLLKYAKNEKENKEYNSQDLFSESNSEILESKISNEISDINDSQDLNSELSDILIKEENKSKKLIYIKNLIIVKENHIKIYLMILSDGTYHIIFRESSKKIIEILINYDKNLIGYIDNKYNYKNIIKLENWRENPCRNFIKRIKWIRKIITDDIKNKIKNKNNNDNI